MTDADLKQLATLLEEARALKTRAWLQAHLDEAVQVIHIARQFLDDAFQLKDGEVSYDRDTVNRAHEVLSQGKLPGVVVLGTRE